jgi:hypothetical protein
MRKVFLIALIQILFLNNSCKNKKAIVAGVQDSYIEFTSDLTGALVEMAVEIDGNNFKPGTGRQVGLSPVTVVLKCKLPYISYHSKV